MTRRSVQARTASSGNPVTASIALTRGEALVVLIKVDGATNRAGGSPTWGPYTLLQANSTQKAATTPEASAEIWYLESVEVAATRTLTIPNTGALAIKYTVEAATPAAGGRAVFASSNGGNNTSTNPTPGAVTITEAQQLAWAITGNGATTWAPSAQAGTIIANTDDGAHGGGEQYSLNPALGSLTLSWTFGTSEDWGALVVAFREIPAANVNNLQSARAGGELSVSERIRSW